MSGTVTVTYRPRRGGRSAGLVSSFSALPGREFGPWRSAEMIRDLTVSALLDFEDAQTLVLRAVAEGSATTETRNP